MAPSATRRLEILEEQTELSLVGSVEVESVETSRHCRLDRITFEPPDELYENTGRLEDDSLLMGEDESVEIDDSILEQISFAFMNGCTGCYCQPLKSALRKKESLDEHEVKDRIVSFSNLQIHEFNMTLGDHPSAVSGPPVALDWNSEAEHRVVNLEDYEAHRTPRRKKKQLKLSYRDRMAILEEQNGYTEEEVNQAWAEALKIRMQRQETLHRGLLLMIWDDLVESTGRKYSRLMDSIGWS